MTKRVFIIGGLYVILLYLLCLSIHASSANPVARVVKNRDGVSAVEVVRARFGSGPDNIGVCTSREANPEGPMSFALGQKGEIYILDQVNKRVQVFKEGKRIKTIPIPFKTFVDIDVTFDGKIVLLDNLVKKSVYILDSEGKTLNIIPLEGRQIPYGPYGRIFLGAYLENGEPSNTILVLSPEGKELVRVKLFFQDMPHEIYHSVRVSTEGHIYQMALDKGGVFIRRYEILE